MRSRCFLSVAIYNLGDRKTDDIAGKRVVPASLGASRNRFDATQATSIGYVMSWSGVGVSCLCSLVKRRERAAVKICEGQFCCVLVCVCVCFETVFLCDLSLHGPSVL